MKTAFRKDNNLGTFVAFLAEVYPSGVCLEKFCNSSRAAGNKSGKVCRARLKSMDVDGRTTFWTLEPHPALPLTLAETFYFHVQPDHLIQTHCPSQVTSCCLLSFIGVFLHTNVCHLLAQNPNIAFQFLAK